MKSNLTSRLALTVEQVSTWATMVVMAMVAHARKAVKQGKPKNHSTLENHMLLYLKNAIYRSGNTSFDFFRTAYLWKYGKVSNSDTDVVQYTLHAIIPRYVRDYINFLQEKENAKL